MEKLFLKFVARAWKSLAVSLNCLIGLGNGLYIFFPCTSLTKKKKKTQLWTFPNTFNGCYLYIKKKSFENQNNKTKKWNFDCKVNVDARFWPQSHLDFVTLLPSCS